MEAKWRWLALAALAPIAWGATYVVTRATLPADAPLYGALLRALPAGLLLLLIVRRLPSGSWWWKSFVLGALNIGAFFVLVYVTAQLLPSGTATTVMSLGAVVMAVLGWLLLGERPAVAVFIGAAIGIVGVGIMVAGGTGPLHPGGVAASLAAMVSSSLGFVLTKRWSTGERVLDVTAWQVLAGALLLAPVAALVEGAPPALDATALGGVAFVSIVATAGAYVVWFSALARLPASSIGIVGLVNPLTGVLLGAVVGGEPLGLPQLAGVGLVVAGMLVARRNRTLRQGCTPPSGPSEHPVALLSSTPSPRRTRPEGSP